MREGCPQCGSQRYKKNGHIHNDKQNHQGKECERQFVGHVDQHLISEEQCALVERSLLERISLRGMCRAVGVGLKGLVAFLAFLKLLRGTARFQRSDLSLVIQQCGAQALPIISLISLLVGLILAFIGAVQLRQFGAQIYVADLVG